MKVKKEDNPTKRKWGGQRSIIIIYKHHEKWAQKNGYRNNDGLNSQNTIGFKDGAER